MQTIRHKPIQTLSTPDRVDLGQSRSDMTSKTNVIENKENSQACQSPAISKNEIDPTQYKNALKRYYAQKWDFIPLHPDNIPKKTKNKKGKWVKRLML